MKKEVSSQLRETLLLFDQHDRRDISQKPPFVVADPKEGPGPLFLETPHPPPPPTPPSLPKGPALI